MPQSVELAPQSRVRSSVLLALLASLGFLATHICSSQETHSPPSYRNPILPVDLSDPDVIRVGEDYYMTVSSFHEVPGLPILHSRDLVHWGIISHAVNRLPSPDFDLPQHGNGVWAPALRYHRETYYIYYGDPDRGIFVVTAKNPTGPWTEPRLVKSGKGLIDPCPLWREDGRAYLVHAWAKSRAGFNSILTVHEMAQDGLSVLDRGTTVFDGSEMHPTIEGPKFYERNGCVYIFAPAGGVKTGWQTVLRSRSPFGPYEDRIVMAQGSTSVNGPHQGGWVETLSGTGWFVHFQDRLAYGRIVHLQPLTWKEDWPVIGEDLDGDGTGSPVATWTIQHTPALPDYAPDGASSGYTPSLHLSDDFDSDSFSPAWQWNANPQLSWSSLTARTGWLRLMALADVDTNSNLWTVPSLLKQRIPDSPFLARVRVDVERLKPGSRFIFAAYGMSYAGIELERTSTGVLARRVTCVDAHLGRKAANDDSFSISTTLLELQVTGDGAGGCIFEIKGSDDTFHTMGARFTLREGRWIGARLALGSLSSSSSTDGGWADVDWIRFTTARKEVFR